MRLTDSYDPLRHRLYEIDLFSYWKLLRLHDNLPVLDECSANYFTLLFVNVHETIVPQGLDQVGFFRKDQFVHFNYFFGVQNCLILDLISDIIFQICMDDRTPFIGVAFVLTFKFSEKDLSWLVFVAFLVFPYEFLRFGTF
jgi:hypothetical protein